MNVDIKEIQKRMRDKVIRKICDKVNKDKKDINELISYSNSRHSELNISIKDFGYKLVETPYEAYIYRKTIIVCPKEEDKYSKEEYIYIEAVSKEHDNALKEYINKLITDKEFVNSYIRQEDIVGEYITKSILKNKTWEDIYKENKYYSSNHNSSEVYMN